MARKFLKDSDGILLFTSSDNRGRAFQIAETITQDLSVKAVVTNVKDKETGEKGHGIYIISDKGDIPPGLMEEAVKLWEEFI